ncbi:MAG: hypothetical protein COB76_05735 [Alphaproteobacteria bacterium]|nr:MAG: hypothetical protein COB76_05735 [Alphaproteobacteria bacterium]
MKRFLTLSVCLFSLTACETLSNISLPEMPDMSTLNPFGNHKEVSKVDVDVDTPTTRQPVETITQNPSSLSTEIAEMERLTGSAPRFDNRGLSNTVIENAINQVTDIDRPAVSETALDQIEDTIENIEIATPTPIEKPNVPDQKIEEALSDAIQETVENTADKIMNVTDTPPAAKALEPIAVVQKIEKDVREITANPTSLLKTNDVAIFDESDLKLSTSKGCPHVKIMPAGRSITYFENELSGSVVAHAVINEIKGGCEVVKGGIELDLDILMRGQISDKGRFEGRKDMEAFMTFPYFVAVVTPQGLPVDKKILATAMRFKPIINDLNHAEKITQFIPMSNVNEAANYRVTVGFQLNRKQLEYNRARNLNRVNNMRIAPDLRRNRSRLSLNPLAN